MLGPAKPRRRDAPITVSLEALVPQDHCYRHLEATLDLGFVREWARELYTDRGRPSIKVQRSFYADYLEKVRGYHATEADKKAIRTRQVWVEPLDAEAKEWHGLRRLRLRGLMNANIQGLLIAAGQNLKRVLAATGWGAASCAL